MPQKPGKFQSKSRPSGGNYSPRKPAGKGGFRERSEGDKPRSFAGKRDGGGFDGPKRGGKPAYGGARKEGNYAPRDRDGAPRGKPRYAAEGDRPYKPRARRDDDRSFGDRPPRREGGFSKSRDGFKKPYTPRDRDDRAPRREGGFSKGRDGFKKPYAPRDRDDRAFGDRPSRREGGFSKGRDGFKKPYTPRDRDDRAFGDRPPRREGGFSKGREDGFKKDGFKKDYAPRDRDDRPARPATSRKDTFRKSDGSSFKGQGDNRPHRSYRRDEDDSVAYVATDKTREKLKSARSSLGAPSPTFLYGVHAVGQALLNPTRAHKRLICTQKGFESIEKAYTSAVSEGLSLPEATIVEREDIDRLLPRDAVHQEVLLDCQPLEDVFLIDILNKPEKDSLIVVLDQVTDPHNVGAILRSAAAFGALAVVVQKLNAPDITGTLAKSASGAVEHVPLVREVNLSRAIEQLKEAGYFCIGLAERGEDTLAGLKPKGKVAIVLGAEGDGLRRLVAESCDALAKLPTTGEIASLNVSNAAAIALYEVVRAKP